MAATYSSFMTTRFYSPVFNTALFDGPFRIYFSQAYESAALKIYHLLQTEHQELWQRLKQWSLESKDHVFLMIYPEQQDCEMVFQQSLLPDKMNKSVHLQVWEEGLALGTYQPKTDEEIGQQLRLIDEKLSAWIKQKQSSNEILAQI